MTGPRIRAMALAAATILLARPAAAETTEPYPIDFVYSGTLLEGFAYDTGWLPASDSTIRIRFVAAIDGEAESEMEGQCWFSWPEAFTFTGAGFTDGGWVAVDYGIDLSMMIEYDLGLLGSGSYDVPLDDYMDALQHVVAEARFDPFLLDGNPDRPVSFEAEQDAVELVDAPISLTTGITLDLVLALKPKLACSLAGDRMVSEAAGIDIAEDLGTAAVAWNDTGAITLPLSLEATLDCTFNLTLVPSLSLCIGTCFELAAFDVDIPVQDEAKDIVYATPDVTLEYPVLGVDAMTIGFGTVIVGFEKHVDLDIANTGRGILEAAFSIEGDDAFDYFPYESLLVPGGEDRQVRLYFMPDSAGLHEATLHVTSNAPAEATKDVTLRGTGEDLPEPEPEDDASTDAGEEDECCECDGLGASGGCGCSVSGAGSGPGALLAIVLLILAIAANRKHRSMLPK